MSNAKLLSSHDLLNDSNLSKEVKDDRGFSADLPASFKDMPSASSSKPVRLPSFSMALAESTLVQLKPSKLRPASPEPEKPKKKRKVESPPPAELSKSCVLSLSLLSSAKRG